MMAILSSVQVFKCLFFKPHVEEYKKITLNVISKTYNITHNNVYIIIQSITVFSLHTFENNLNEIRQTT